MKNKGMIITLIILLSIITVFLVMFLVACLKGGFNFKNGFFNLGYKSTNIVYEKQFDLEDIKHIEIKQDAGDIIFKETMNNYIQLSIYGENENGVEVDLNNGNLNIDYTHKRKFSFLNFGVTKNGIIVYIPHSYSDEINIKNDYGICEITDLENATINIDCDAGDVQLGKVKNVNIKCDYGNIDIKEILNKCKIKADCGNIEIDKVYIQEDSSIKADLGNIDIKETNDIYIDADVDLGKTNIEQNNRNAEITLKLDCDCGNVTIGK